MVSGHVQGHLGRDRASGLFRIVDRSSLIARAGAAGGLAGDQRRAWAQVADRSGHWEQLLIFAPKTYGKDSSTVQPCARSLGSSMAIELAPETSRHVASIRSAHESDLFRRARDPADTAAMRPS